MELLRWKTRIALLWLIEAVGMSVWMFLFFLDTGVIEGIITGEFYMGKITEGGMLWMSAFWYIPFVMAWLSMTLKDSANRWTNFILGILFAINMVFGFVINSIGGRPVFLLVNYIVGLAAAILIAWHAWKWPKQLA
jgi:hypothetical protein